MSNHPAGAYALALASLPGIGPATLAGLLRSASPQEVWESVLAGRVQRPEPQGQLALGGMASRGRPQRRSWSDAARLFPLEERWQAAVGGGIGVTWLGGPDYPPRLAADLEPPGVIFWKGGVDILCRPCVAVVGTRKATPEGVRAAGEIAEGLADAGVIVVSGIALGIDGAAHRGALRSPGLPGLPSASVTIGVAASGVDVPYPVRHRYLWEEIVARGTVISESPPGRPAQSWRFPSRNRVIAALARFVVVVESGETGGSMHTVESAMKRGIDVGAVPGPVHSPASAGTNRLLFEGAFPVRSAEDVLGYLSLEASSGTPPDHGDGQRDHGPPRVGGEQRRHRSRGVPGQGRPEVPLAHQPVLQAVGWTPASLSRVVDRCGLTLPAVAASLDWLEQHRWVEEGGGMWCRRS